MSARKQLYVIMGILVILGLGLTAYKHIALGFPLAPGAVEEVWTVQARIRFDATGEPAKVILNLPDDTEHLVIVDAGGAAPGFGFDVQQAEHEILGIWAARDPEGLQTLYYQARVHRGRGDWPDMQEEAPPAPKKPDFSDAKADAADAVLADAFARSADAATLATRLVTQFRSKEPDDNVRALLRTAKGETEVNQLLLDLLHSAGIPAHLLRGIDLKKVGRRSTMLELLEFHDGERWVVLDQRNGKLGMPEFFLPWQRGGVGLFQIEGGSNSDISYSVRIDVLAARDAVLTLGKAQGTGFLDFSIYSLPVDVQNTFASLLLIPIGALIVVVLRNLVGLTTSGTFMPILIALALVQTTLVTGLVLFVVVVGFGLLIRSYLTHLNLLLIPRLAAVLIVVIMIYVILSIVGFKLGFTAAFSVTLFPMIIISWTIERMSVLWDEEGPRQVLIQGGGSLLTAVFAYLVMTNSYIAFLAFAYPELLFILLAMILAIGQYTGYRLTELRRFEPLAREL